MGEKKPHKIQKKVIYTRSAIDYLGLVSWSFISRCGSAVQKAGASCVDFVSIPDRSVKRVLNTRKKKKTDKPLHSNENNGKIIKLESSILELKKRLALLEKHGVAYPTENKNQDKFKIKKEIDEKKRAVLRMFVDDNKRLRELM